MSLEGQDPNQQRGGDLWSPQEETYYGQRSQQQNGNGNGDSASVRTAGSGRWHYPANFEDTIAEPSRKKSKKKKEKKDRWARTEDAYSVNQEYSSSSGSKRRKSKKKRSTIGPDDETYSRQSGSTTEFPEDPEGGLYGDTRHETEANKKTATNADDIFSHEL